MRLQQINFFQIPVKVDILTSSHEWRMVLTISRMMDSFQKVFVLTRSIKGIIIHGIYSFMKCISQK